MLIKLLKSKLRTGLQKIRNMNTNDFALNKKHFAVKAFRNYFLSSVIGTVGLSLAAFTDAVVAGQYVGDEGLAAFSICAPILSMITLFSTMISVGAGFFVSYYIGENNPAKANAFFSLGMLVGIVITVIFTVCCLIPGDNLFIWLGAPPDSKVLYYSRNYMTILLATSFAFILSPLLSLCARSDSSPKLAGATAFIGAFLNIILDIVLVNVMENKMFAVGLAGAIGYVIGFFCCFIHFFKKNIMLRLRPTFAGLHLKDVWKICANGIGVASFRFYQCVVFIAFNIILVRKFGDDQLAVLGVLINVNLVVCAIYEGISSAIVSLVAIYRGEMEKPLIQITVKQSLKYTLGCSIVIGSVIYIFTDSVTSIFGVTGAEVIKLSDLTLKYFALAMIVMGVNTTLTTYAQSMEYPRFAFISSTMRNFLLLVAFTFLIVLPQGVQGIPLAILYAEGLVLAATFILALAAMIKRGYDNIYLVENYNLGLTCAISIDTTYKVEFDDIVQRIEKYCEDAKLPKRSVLFIRLIIEEFVMNIIAFGVKDKKRHFIDIKIFSNEGDTVVNIRDDVSVFNPIEVNGQADEIGGKVLEMIRHKAKFCEYQRKIIFNNLLIRF